MAVAGLFFSCRAFAGRGTHKRGQRRSVEVASRPGFEVQLRAGDQLCSVKAGQTRAVGEGGGPDIGILRYWRGPWKKMGRIISMEGVNGREEWIRPTGQRKRKRSIDCRGDGWQWRVDSGSCGGIRKSGREIL
ncbi:hypothetical protein M441DRAFT_411629 [Trichoderma asperellum CBS 433.97]|uniref:Uncharacterized protein n=1 Tax=Trichoderma asperellum (strain ATCC 204424 / CBS 433.97 / NBRC 101777) TaxID=1042311 RepID=A0A2T3Z7I8_TRIA4|nr:hypothetical protein M441DRAFT_411629 [Trichoderma asperellum CBS 433.97]PTB40758.1 hypothetical protein M441DRAFT_411629 [Trichoderma asperellum CBS 433.97]WVH32633.1 hypothetical protein [Trichoderma asperellum]